MPFSITLLEPPAIDLGEVEEGQIITGSALVRNESNHSVTIGSVRTSCGCTTATDLQTLAPGQSQRVFVTFDTTGRQGKTESCVWLTGPGFENPPIELKIVSNVVKQFTIEPRSVDFGTVTLGASRTAKVSIRRADGRPFRISGSQGDAASLGSISTISPIQTDITVKLPPRMIANVSHRDVLTVLTDQSIRQLNIPITYDVAPLFTVVPPNANLGVRRIGERGTVTLRLAVSDSVSLRIVSSPAWAKTSIAATSRHAGALRTLQIWYSIRGKGGVTLNDNVILKTNDASQPEIVVPVLCAVENSLPSLPVQ